MTPYVGQKCIVTACGVEGPGEVVEVTNDGRDILVRVDFSHPKARSFLGFGPGSEIYFDPGGKALSYSDVIVRFLSDANSDATPGAPYTRTETGTIRYVLGDQACVEFKGRLEIVSLGGGE